MNYKSIIEYCAKILLVDLLIIVSVWITIYLQLNTSNVDIDKCYLSIQNFVTMRHFCHNVSKDEQFDLKTYISSYSKPYLIQLLQQETKDCLCAQ